MKENEASSGDKRQHNRYELNYRAQVSSDNQTPHSSMIRNFSESGLLITYQDAIHLIGNEELTPGNTLDVNFDVATPSGMKHYHLRAQIARALDNGVGLKLLEPDPATIRVLHAICRHGKKKQVQEHKAKGNLDVNQFVMLCKQDIEQQMTPLVIQFFRMIRENLFNYSKDALNNQEQAHYMDARDLLENKRKNIESQFMDNVLKQINNFLDRQIKTSTTHATEISALSLIDKDIFDDWLVVRVIASKAENQFSTPLYQLHQRLSYLLRQEISEKNNPIGPTFICEAFQKVVHHLEIERNPERAIYEAFEKAIIAHLGAVYNSINKTLINHGIMPEIKQKSIENKSQNSAVPGQKQDINDNTQEQANRDQEPGTNIEEIEAIPAPQQNARSNKHTQEVHKKFSNIKQNISQLDRTHSETKQDSAVVSSDSGKKSGFNTFKTLSNLLQKVTHRNQPQAVPSDHPKLDTENLVDRLNFIQKNSKNMINTPLKESVGQMLDNDLTEFDRHSLSENDQNSVEMIDELVDSMIDTNTLVPEVNDMFKELRIPLLKVILKDDSFFDSRVHPARQVLDRIARLGAQGTANPNLKKQLDQTVSNIIEHDNEGLDIYFDELKKLDKIIDKQNTIYKKNVDRITKVCEGQQKTNKARQRVFQEIDKRTAGKSIPKLALDCLDGGWRNLLLLTSIREGEESKNWGLFLQVLDRLLLLNEKKAPHVKVDLFINVLKTGLTTACGGQFKHAQLVEEIKAIIDQQESGTHTCNLELVDIPPIDNQEQEKPPAARESVKDEQGKVFAIGKPNERFSRWVKRAKRMQLGDWLELKADDNSVQKVRLAWVGEDFSKIVFINHQGLKVIDLSLQEIASLLQDRKAKFIVEQDNSIVNVALENMVKKIYDNLAHQATHDDMTDLLTRNEFERRIDRSIELALGEKFAHCVCHIAIHQFKLLKTTYSYEESDQILQEFAKAINNIMTMDNIHCGRIGDSDFGVLFENVGTEEAYHLLSKFTEHLENNKIQISDKTIGLNVNIGLVGIKTHKAKISGILKQAEQASETAEKAGINRIHIYTEEVQTKREEISWVSNVDSILNEGKLHLRSQAIQSLKKGDNDAWSHSEILLAVVDDQGKERSPEDLIYVAEEFRKMSLIDRWVIKNIFNWMSNNPAEVEKLGGCSINLSGHSLNDESFTEFLFEEFANTTLDKKQICFEITETTAIANLEEAADFISELRNYGCHFSLDDFGSGLSSYAYLKHLPVDFIKIDGSFIRQLKAESNEYAMVKSISDMGHYMGKEIIAESVENKEIMDLLKTIGIDYAQGYYIQKPQTLSLS